MADNERNIVQAVFLTLMTDVLLSKRFLSQKRLTLDEFAETKILDIGSALVKCCWYNYRTACTDIFCQRFAILVSFSIYCNYFLSL